MEEKESPNYINEEEFFGFNKELKNSMKKINERLIEVESLSYQEFSDTFRGAISGEINDILKSMTKAIYNSYIKIFNNETKEQEFYFWNGYTCIDGKRRLTLKSKANIYHDFFGNDNYATGIGYYYNRNDLDSYFECPNSYWYNVLLNSSLVEKGEINFPPPSTNYWMQTQNPKKNSIIKLKRDKSVFNCLSFHYNNDINKKDIDKEERIIIDKNGHIQILLIKDDLLEKIDVVDKHINVERDNRFTEYDSESFIEYAMQSKQKANRTEEEIKCLKKLQHEIYSIWFASAFNPAIIEELIKNLEKNKNEYKKINAEKLYEHIIAYKKKYNDYKRAKNKDGKKYYREVDFNFWYNLFIDNYSKKNELGSFMLLSKKPVDNWIINSIFFYVKNIYAKIRSIEARARFKHEVKKSAISSVMSRNMSHNWGSHSLIYMGREKFLDHFVDGNLKDVKKQLQYYPEILSNDDIRDWEKNYYKISPLDDGVKTNKLTRGFINRYSNQLRVRMDFIADIVTNVPSSENTRMLQRDLLDHFLGNFILANTISGTNNFKYRFRINYEGVDVEDVSVSVPNDVLGQDAFSVILENIIRNSAKHGSSSKVIYDVFVKDGYEIETRDENDMKFNLSPYYKITIFEKYKNGYSTCSKVEHQNTIINTPVITDDNKLRPGGWGMIEMKASAAYLRKFAVETIDDDPFKLDINKKGKWNNNERDANKTSPTTPYLLKAVCHLNNDKEKLGFGYSFFLMKPKEILIFDFAGKINIRENKDETKAKLLNLGITLLQDHEINLNNIYNHKILISIPKDDKGTQKKLNDYTNKLPKRIIFLDESQDNENKDEINPDYLNIVNALQNVVDFLQSKEESRGSNDTINYYDKLKGLNDKFHKQVFIAWKSNIFEQDLYNYKSITASIIKYKSIAIGTSYFFDEERQEYMDNAFKAHFSLDHAQAFWAKVDFQYFDIGTSYSRSRLPFCNKSNDGEERIATRLKKGVKYVNFESIELAESLLKKIGVVDERLQEFAFNTTYPVPTTENKNGPKVDVPFYILLGYMGIYFPPKEIKNEPESFYQEISTKNINNTTIEKINIKNLDKGQLIDLMSKDFKEILDNKNSGKNKSIEEKLIDWIASYGREMDYLLIHLGVLEKMFGTDPEVLKNKYKEQIIDKLHNTKVIIISGRGKPDNLPDGELFLNYSQVAAYISDNQSKYMLTELCLSSRAPINNKS